MTTTSLREERCTACRRGEPPATPEEIAGLHPRVGDWRIVEEEGIQKLTREFRFPSFAAALAFTEAVGAIAEEEGHHPRIVTEWGRATVTWWTHAIHGLHRNDFIMAAKTDALHGR